jgi:hypothetical protein
MLDQSNCDSAPSEARKRGSEGGSAGKLDDFFIEGILPSNLV